MLDLKNVSGIGEFVAREGEGRVVYYAPNEKAFLMEWGRTIEVRCDRKLGRKLREEFESVMESRYFGRGGIEIVMCGQLEADEVDDLVRLSYNLTMMEGDDES